MEPEYEAAAKLLLEDGIPLFEVDCVAHPSLCAEHNISGYPALKVFGNGVARFEYPRGLGRTKEDISAYLRMSASPAVKMLETEEVFADFLKGEGCSILAAFDKSEENVSKYEGLFSQIANEMRSSISFGQTFLPGHDELIGSRPSLIVIEKGLVKARFSGEWAKENMTSFIKLEKIPFFGKLDENTFNSYVEAAFPIVFVFTDQAGLPNIEETMTKAAQKYKGSFSIAWIDALIYEEYARNIGLSGEKFPAVSVYNITNGLKYPYPETNEVSFEKIDSFLAGVLDRSVSPYFRSEPVPAEDGKNLKTIVHSSLNSTVYSSDKDVLMEVFAPWCPGCRRLEKLYEKLADAYSISSDKIVISKFNIDANDLPVHLESAIRSIPAIFLFPAGGNIETFFMLEEEARLSNIVKFIKQNAK